MDVACHQCKKHRRFFITIISFANFKIGDVEITKIIKDHSGVSLSCYFVHRPLHLYLSIGPKQMVDNKNFEDILIQSHHNTYLSWCPSVTTNL